MNPLIDHRLHRRWLCVGLAACACWLAGLVTPAMAASQHAGNERHAAPQSQGYGHDQGHDNRYGPGYGQVVRCESRDAKYRHCRADTRGGVELIRGLSRTYCTEGRNWGWDRNGIWVTGGCRAEFRTRGDAGGWSGGGRPGGWPGNGHDARQIVRCDSNDGRHPHTCAIPRNAQVRLHRQISKTRCRQDRNWGYAHDQIWVSGGCRAEFEVTARAGNGHGNGNGWGGGNHGNGWGNEPALVRCDSNDARTQHCPALIRGGARLARQISNTRCVQDRNWGWNRDGLWVSGGCRAEFQVW